MKLELCFSKCTCIDTEVEELWDDDEDVADNIANEFDYTPSPSLPSFQKSSVEIQNAHSLVMWVSRFYIVIAGKILYS